MNYRISSIFIALLLLFVSCQKIEPEDNTEKNTTGEVYVTCTFSQKQSNIEDTRANTPIYEIAKRITFVVYQNKKVIKTIHQLNGGSNNFGTMSIALPAGVYQLMIFAHNELSDINVIEDGSIMLANSMPSGDCFSYSAEIEIKADSRKTETCKLTRAVSLITIVSDELLDDKVSTAQITYTGVSHQYKLLNCIGSSSTTLNTGTIKSDAFKNSTGHFEYNQYVFLNGTESTVNATIKLFDANKQELYSKSLIGIQAKINTKTTVTSSLLSGISTTSITADTDWGDEITQRL